jgi:ABC-2 type transport system ATP-binding protein
MNKPAVIQVKNYSHSFGKYQVINNLSFEVYQGDVFGFLGANGSGKTTTIRTLLGIYRASSGQLTVNGRPFSPTAISTLGYLPEERGLYKKESVIDTMVYFGQLKNMSRTEARHWSIKYLKRVDLADKANVRLDKLSGGQQQKVQLGVTIMNRPELLILDEPTKGFDPVNRRLMMEIVQESQQQGATIILVTHQMEEVERFCNRLLLLKNGRSRLYGDISDIKSQYGTQIIALGFNGKIPDNPKLYTISKQAANTAELLPTKNAHGNQILSYLIKQSELEILRFELEQMSLDDIFVQIYNENEGLEDA